MVSFKIKRPTARIPRSTGHRAHWLSMALLAVCLGLFAATVAAAVTPYDRWAEELGIDQDISYDGTRIMEIKDGRFEIAEHRAPGKMYTMVDMGNMASGVIIREDLQKSYILMPSMGFYREESLEGGLMQSSNDMEFSDIEKVGWEKINGHGSSKFKLRFKDKEGKGAGFLWVTDTGVPIKMDMIYSSKDVKGLRYSMELIELNLREQDPDIFEVPANLKPMNMGSMSGLGQMMQQGTAPAATEPTAPAPTSYGGEALTSEQQRCLDEAMQAAQEKQKKKRGFGRLMNAVARTASRFGATDMARVSGDVYSANATAADVSAAAKDLGITEDDIERCRQP